ncbi:capsid staple protein [Hydrogenophaga aquatica]
MIDMKLKPEAKTMLGEAVQSDAPEYPYGLRIMLDNESLTKLGITDLPAIDTELKVTAVARVVSVSQHESQGSDKPHRSVDLQIETMELASPGGESGQSQAQRMYAASGMNA